MIGESSELGLFFLIHRITENIQSKHFRSIANMKTYSGGVKNLGKQPTTDGTVTANESEDKKVENIFRYGKSALKSLIQMFPKEARQYVRELDISEPIKK